MARARGPPISPDVYRYDYSARFIGLLVLLLVGLALYGFIEFRDTPVLAWIMAGFIGTMAIAIPFINHFWTRHQWVQLHPNGIQFPKSGIVPYDRVLSVHRTSAYGRSIPTLRITYLTPRDRTCTHVVHTYMDRCPEFAVRLRKATPRARWSQFPGTTPYEPN